MSGPRIGSLFSGYGGLDIGVQQVLGGSVVWHVEFDAAPSKILAHHWPDVPNYGDVTAVDWSQVEPVDVLTGGFPCQDVSLAGLRRGLKEGTRSGLWSEFARAIDVLRPQLVVIENVRGLLSAEATGVVESDPWDLGDGRARPTLRALGAVLGDLADLGYDARWCGVRAADAGAPHGRFRIFITAFPAADTGGEAVRVGTGLCEGIAAGVGWGRSDDDGMEAATADATARSAFSERARAGSPNGGADVVADSDGGAGGRRADDSRRSPIGGTAARGNRGAAVDWQEYRPAIELWESVIGRRAPRPAEPTGARGAYRLSSRFVEWMMGLDSGHVTAAGVDSKAELRALGNGVVPQQAALAILWLLGVGS